MKLQDVFDQLSVGEFSQISIGGEAAGVINECNQDKVVQHLNLGLTAIYKRFNLREGRLRFTLDTTADTYAVQAADLLKIERVMTDDGTELTLNDYNDPYSCFTPSMNSIRLSPAIASQNESIPDCYKTQGLTVVYRANHPKVTGSFGYIDPEMIELELPESHLMALLYFLASRAHNPIGMSAEFNAGNIWYAKYEAECQDLENKGLQVQETEQANRLHRNGWV